VLGIIQQSYRGVSVELSTSFTANSQCNGRRPLEFTERTTITEERSLAMLLHAVQRPLQT